MNRVYAILSILAIFIVSSAFIARIIPVPMESIKRADHKYVASISSESAENKATTETKEISKPKSTKKTKSKKNSKKQEKKKPAATPAPTKTPAKIKKTTAPKNTQKHTVPENFNVADAPYTKVNQVSFDTLINLNNRLSPKFTPEGMVRVSDYIDSDLLKLCYSDACGNETAILALSDMLCAARDNGVTGFALRSVYRSYNTQIGLWNLRVRQDRRYGKRYGEPLGSAYPGSSEHQTGLAFDITCRSAPEASTSFKNTIHYKWLRDNSYKYGFILRYQRDKTHITGIKFEPYHYRYVGIDVATELYNSGKCLEEYHNTSTQYMN